MTKANSTAQAVTTNSNYVVKVSDNLQDRSGQVSIDTLSITFPLTHFKELYEIGNNISETQSSYLLLCWERYVRQYIGLPFTLEAEVFHGRNFFKNQVKFDSNAGFIAFGGNNVVRVVGQESRTIEEKAQLYITGEGCLSLTQAHFSKIAEFLTLTCGDIKRIDIAFDDFHGNYTVDYAIDQWKDGGFQKNGKPPVAKLIDDMGSDEGSSFYVGKRESGLMFRAYDKGKQLGDKSSKWTRFEVEILSKDRDIPLEILSNPTKYFAGAYPCLDFVSQIKEVIRTCRERLKIQFSELIQHARTGYGRLINFMMKEMDYDYEQVVMSLLNHDGYPSRLRWTITV